MRDRIGAPRPQSPSWTPEINKSEPLARGLLGYWPFNASAIDLVSGLRGTLGSTARYANIATTGTALQTDGTSTGYMTVPNPATMATPSFSIAAVVTIGAFGSYSSIYTQRTATGAQGLYVKTDGRLAAYFYSNALISIDGPGYALSLKDTLSIVAAYTASTGILAIYVGGALYASVSGPAVGLDTTVPQAYWGADSFDLTGRTFNGTIGPCGLWNRGLTQDEAKQFTIAPYGVLRPQRPRPVYFKGPAVVASARRPHISMVA